MSHPTAELLISPRFNEKKMKTVEKRLAQGLRRSIKKAHLGQLLDDTITKGFSTGATKGSRIFSDKVRLAQAAIAIAGAAIIKDTFDKTLGHADSTAERIRQQAMLMEESYNEAEGYNVDVGAIHRTQTVSKEFGV
jgi:hypothetical protein